jgi:hypothetical protein
MKGKISIFLFVSLMVGSCSLAILARAGEVHHLNNFVGDWTYSVLIKQPGITSMNFGKANIKLTDPNIISSKFGNHDVKFILEYNPSKKNYLITYSFKNRGDAKPLLSLDEIALTYSEEAGYTGRETNEEEKWNLEVTIKTGEGKFDCKILSTIKGKTFEHNLSCWKSKS